MDHVALDRTGSDDRQLDHKVVELVRLDPRQHRHLRAAFDLKNAQRVGLLDHCVDGWIVVLEVGHADLDTLVCSSRLEARFMQPSMPRPSTSTFMNFKASISSLSHSMISRSAIRAGSIGTKSSSRSWVSTKPSGCCDRWRGVPISWRARSSGSSRRWSSALRLRRRPARPGGCLFGQRGQGLLRRPAGHHP